MPNWSFTRMEITVYPKDADKLKELFNKIKEWTSKNYIESDFGTNWLGNIVGFADIDDKDNNGDFKVSCRGSLESINIDDNVMYVQTETAWSPMFEMWHRLMKKYVSDEYELSYDSFDDCGNYYITNDPKMMNHYFIDSDYDEALENKLGYDPYNWEATEDALINIYQDLLDTGETDLEKLTEMFEESEYSEMMYVRKWEYQEAIDY